MKSPDYFIFPPSYCFLACISTTPFLSNVIWVEQQTGLNTGIDCLNGLKVDGWEVRRPGDEGIRKSSKREELRTRVWWVLPLIPGWRARERFRPKPQASVWINKDRTMPAFLQKVHHHLQATHCTGQTNVYSNALQCKNLHVVHSLLPWANLVVTLYALSQIQV